MISFSTLSFAAIVWRSFHACVFLCHLYLTYISYIRRYTANKSMDGCAFCNADGDFLIVPQKGSKQLSSFFQSVWLIGWLPNVSQCPI